jgi:hypothetical protein
MMHFDAGSRFKHGVGGEHVLMIVSTDILSKSKVIDIY